MTAYLKAPETGIYEFEVQKIGGEARVNIITEETDENGTVTEKENSINGSGTTGGDRGSTGASSWPSTGVVPTAEGMDVPTSTTKLNLEAGKVYKITVTAAAEAAKQAAANAKEELKTLSEKLSFSMKEAEIKKVKNSGKKKATVTWKKVSGADGYVIQYAKKASMKSAKKVVVTNGTTSSRKIGSLKSKTRYFVRIRAYKNIGGEKIYTSYSAISSVKVN